METVNIANEKEWEEFITFHPESNFLQSYAHGKTHENIGKKVIYLGYKNKSKLLGVCLLIIEHAKRGKHAIIPGGPILDWTNKELIQTWVKSIKSITKQEKCIFVRVRPQLPDNSTNQALFRKLGFVKAPMHLSAQTTLQLDLNKPPKQLLADMRKTTRYEIRKAERLGIEIKKSKNLKDVELFCKLQKQTAKRHNFIPFPDNLISSEYANFVQKNQATLYTAKLKNKILAQAIIIHYPTESSYHFGASTDLGRKYPGAHLIQWTAILDAKKRGILRYNFWGIVEKDQTKHRFYGVSVFKRGFGGNQVNYLPARDLVIDSLRYKPLFILESIRRVHRNL